MPSDSYQAAIEQAAAVRDAKIDDARDAFVEAQDAAESEYRQTVAAIRSLHDLGWDLVRREGFDAARKAEELQEIKQAFAEGMRPSLTDAVRQCIEAMDTTFNVKDVEAWINEQWPGLSPAERRASLSGILLTFVDDKIEVVLRGSGSRPSTYKAIEDHEFSEHFGGAA